MPNWCENSLDVTGPEKDIKTFEEKARGEDEDGVKCDLSLHSLFPTPEELVGTTSPCPNPRSAESRRLKRLYGANNWYDWNINKWGTKWDVSGSLCGRARGSIIYSFDSAWSPPLEWLKKVAQDFPSLTFSLWYREPGMCFQGTAQAHGKQFRNHAEPFTPDEEEDEEFESVEEQIDNMRKEKFISEDNL